MSYQSTESSPCPFCGGISVSDGEILTTLPSRKSYTQSECQDCGAIGPAANLDEGEIDYGDMKAIAAWNTRAIASVKREPLSDMKIDLAFDESMRIRPKEASNAETRRLFARCVEAAHGILGENENG